MHDFETWFTLQYGPRPSALSDVALREQAGAARRLADELERLETEAETWERLRSAALRAWAEKTDLDPSPPVHPRP